MSTYTANLGIEKPASGDQAGTWGTTTNTNFDIIDRAINGVGEITVSSTSQNLTTSDGALSDGGYKVLSLSGTPGGTATLTITPNTQEKLYFVYNNTGESVIFTQGSGGNVTVEDGATKIIYADGAGGTAKVSDFTGSLSVDASVLKIDGTEVTSTADELNLLDGSAAGTIANSKAVIYGAAGEVNATTLQLGGTSLTATADELNYVDGVTSNIQTQLDNISATTLPPGSILPYAGSSAPSGFLLCYGQAIDRTTYASLFSAIGTTYGAGDGSTTFNLPDLRGRLVAGQDDMGGSSADRLTNQSGGVDGDTLGATGGSETHTLTTAQMPTHQHDLSSLSVYSSFDTSYGSPFSALQVQYMPSNRSYRSGDVHNDYFSGTSGNEGDGGAHNNVQPTIILNYMIKT